MPNAAAVQFAVKTVMGAELALGFAMQLGLSQPLLAMMTAIIVAQPLSGMVMQKGLARLCGTLVGMAMSLVLMRFVCTIALATSVDAVALDGSVYRRFDPAAQCLGLCLRAGRLHGGHHLPAGTG